MNRKRLYMGYICRRHEAITLRLLRETGELTGEDFDLNVKALKREREILSET